MTADPSSTGDLVSIPAGRQQNARQTLEHVLNRRSIPMRYQPVVELESGEIVGYEALARPLPSPGSAEPVTISDLQSVAVRQGSLSELDWICRTSALTNPAVLTLPRSLVWLVNCEPSTLASECPADLDARLAAIPSDLRVVTEVTERGLESDPIALFRGVGAARRRGEAVAIDDLGVNAASLAVLPLLEPDLVKLDMSLMQSFDDPSVARVCGAVRSLHERRALVVIAEGIESATHVRMASLFGATYGQGFGLGRPAPLPERLRPPTEPIGDQTAEFDRADHTPFELLAAEGSASRATKELLVPLTRHLELQAEERNEPLALLTSFADPVMFTPKIKAKYSRLAGRYAFVAVFNGRDPAGLPESVRKTLIHPTDRLAVEWNIVVIGPHFGAALSARSLGDEGPDLRRRFDYVLTHDRDLVERAARALMNRATA